tara:strand:- start:541 stop:1584 length:1044 start_codon:yes stop_codon:yes gene_type:complete
MGGGGFLQRGLSKGGFTAGNGEWTDTGDVIHPGDASGDETLVIGGTTEAGADIILNKTGAAIFNEQSASVDFRVESNGDTHCLFVDGSANGVGIGESTPDGKLDVFTGSISNDLHVGFKETGANIQQIQFREASLNFFALEHDASGMNPNNMFKIRAADGGDGTIDVTNAEFKQDGTVTLARGHNEWANPGATPSSATHVIHSWHGGLADIDEGNQLRVTFTIPDLSQNQFETTFAESRFFQATLYVLGNYHPSGSATDLRYSGLFKIEVGAIYEDRSHVTTTLLNTTSSAGGWTALTTGNVAINSAGDTSLTLDIDNPQSSAHMDFVVWVQFAHNCTAIALSEVAA